jgi:hypothetical protein
MKQKYIFYRKHDTSIFLVLNPEHELGIHINDETDRHPIDVGEKPFLSIVA